MTLRCDESHFLKRASFFVELATNNLNLFMIHNDFRIVVERPVVRATGFFCSAIFNPLVKDY